jgi:AIR synthase-related protein
MSGLAVRCAAMLAESAAFRAKCDIGRIAAGIDRTPKATLAFRERSCRILIGDDTAAIPDGDGYLLFAAEGMLPGFLDADPYFAGFSSVMVNVSDVAAMGGYPLAVVDAYFHAPSSAVDAVVSGMRDACDAYGVPLVGGHTTCREGGPHCLAVAILGRARHLLTSFGARPGDVVLLASDLRGAYRGSFPFFNATTGRTGESLRDDLATLGALAESGDVHACKDVSNAGIAGTLLMLFEASGVGGTLDLDRLPMPAGVTLERWLATFPSFGFLLSVPEGRVTAVRDVFGARGIACEAVGRADATRVMRLVAKGEEAVLWDLGQRPFTGFGGSS